jgi:predicted nucleotidyltransferase component of viral defense system
MSFAKFWKIWVLDLERSEASKIEGISFKDLERIGLEARNFGIDLVLIGGYAVRAYTEPRSWRFTKDIDFITTRKDLTALRGVLELLNYGFERTEFGVKGSKKINCESIELHISVDKVIDWSTNLEYRLPEDIFIKANVMSIEASFQGKDLKVGVMVAPIEDVLIMKLMTERTRDHFDAIAIILDSFEKVNAKRFWRNSKQSGLSQHVKKRLGSFLKDLKKGLVKKLWKEFTGRGFIREQEVTLKERVIMLLEKDCAHGKRTV